MHHGIDAVTGKSRARLIGKPADSQFHPVGEIFSEQSEGEIKHQPHDQHESGQGGIFPRQEFIQSFAALSLPALARLHHRVRAKPRYVPKAHIRKRRHRVRAALRLHLPDDVPRHFLFVFRKPQGV